jgi:hypothetical protein
VKIGDHMRRLLVRRHQAKRALEGKIVAGFEVRKIAIVHRQRLLESQLDEPSRFQVPTLPNVLIHRGVDLSRFLPTRWKQMVYRPTHCGFACQLD